MPDRIRVVQLIDGFATEEKSGGAAQFGIQLARHLDRSRYQPFVCGLWGYNTPSERRWRAQLHAEGIGTTILVEHPRRLGSDFVRAVALADRWLQRIQPQILNSHFERGDLLALLLKSRHPRALQIVRTMHTDQQWQTRPWLGALLNLLAFPFMFGEEIAISEATRRVLDRRLSARLARKRSVVVYNGVRADLLQHNRKDRIATRDSTALHIAIVGRLEEQKGHEYLLYAFRRIHDELPASRLSIIGTGSLMAELKQLTKTLGLDQSVSFLGQRADVVELLSTVNVLVSASLWEGFPTVLLEAMAVGVPVVATDVSGSRELVRTGETGMLVPPRSAEAIAEAVFWLHRHPAAAAQMAHNAWHDVHRYTLEAAAAKYDQCYRQLAAHRSIKPLKTA